MTETQTCPAGICGFKALKYDPDRMFGHLLMDHRWTFETANGWMADEFDYRPELEPEPGEMAKGDFIETNKE